MEPVVTTHELPAPEGCRSLAVKECYKIPIIVPRKVPYEVGSNLSYQYLTDLTVVCMM